MDRKMKVSDKLRPRVCAILGEINKRLMDLGRGSLVAGDS